MLLRPGPVVIEKLLSSSAPEPRTKMLLFLGIESLKPPLETSTFKKASQEMAGWRCLELLQPDAAREMIYISDLSLFPHTPRHRHTYIKKGTLVLRRKTTHTEGYVQGESFPSLLMNMSPR